MPTQLREFNSSQDALTVFMDYRTPKEPGRQKEEQEQLRAMLAEYFDPQQLLYLCGTDCEKSGAMLYQDMRERIQSYEAVLPRSNRFVFCHYLRLNDLSEAWIDGWQARIQEFQARMPVLEVFQQYHVVCVCYESSEEPLGEQKGRTAALLRRLGTELRDIGHVTYLLYTSGFETLTRQNQGICWLLYLLGRADASTVLFPMQNRTWLKRLSYSDYSEEKAEMWSGLLNELDLWLLGERDPGLLTFLGAVRSALQGPVRIIQDAEMEFDSRVEVYPVHIEDFVKVGILGARRESRIGSDHPIIQKRKEEYFADQRAGAAAGIDYAALVRLAQEDMYYKDLQSLAQLMRKQPGEDGSLERRMCSTLLTGEEGRAAEEIEKLIAEVCGRLRGALGCLLDGIEEERAKKQREKQRAQKELDIAGRFGNTWDCFKKIAGETAFRPLDGRYPEYQRDICLIGSRCYDRWYIEQYEIAGIDYARYCADIDPADIVLLKTGDLLELDQEEAEEKLTRML